MSLQYSEDNLEALDMLTWFGDKKHRELAESLISKYGTSYSLGGSFDHYCSNFSSYRPSFRLNPIIKNPSKECLKEKIVLYKELLNPSFIP